MASNVSGSTAIWNAGIRDVGNVVGELGDLEHMRSVLGPPAVLKEGELVWITDRTPHESLPVPGAQYRQYFRLVTSEISIWYEQHNTPNPLGTKPPPEVKIEARNKFDSAQAESKTVGKEQGKGEQEQGKGKQEQGGEQEQRSTSMNTTPLKRLSALKDKLFKK
eukprot:g75639.t1